MKSSEPRPYEILRDQFRRIGDQAAKATTFSRRNKVVDAFIDLGQKASSEKPGFAVTAFEAVINKALSKPKHEVENRPDHDGFRDACQGLMCIIDRQVGPGHELLRKSAASALDNAKTKIRKSDYGSETRQELYDLLPKQSDSARLEVV